MKRFFKYLSLVAVSIALTTACEKTDENALPNLPLKLSTDEANAKNVTLTLEKGKTFPEATKKEDNKGGGKGQGGNKGGGKGNRDVAPTSITIVSGSSDYSIKSLNEAVATASLKKMSVEIKAIETGTTTIVITDNYTQQTKEIAVKVTTANNKANNGNNGGNKGGGKKKN
ncbi:hypothetical protein [Capnocytophaga sputigena]|uniref:hypothetical protein n=1 Tax=Capnocytophaga sputigena TaxID=1019 RepID=UPI0028F01EF6|nr:hypothetical protein [Capnocytophaga sputigena]